MASQSARKNTNFILERIRKQKNISFAGLPYLKLTYFSIILCVLSVLSIVIFQSNIPPKVPLFYGLPDGEFQLADRLQLIIPSTISLGLILINVVVAYLLKNEFLQQALILAGVVAAMFSTITTIKIILLVGSF